MKLSILWFLIVTGLSLMPSDISQGISVFSDLHLDKVVHFGFYFILAYLCIHSLVNCRVEKKLSICSLIAVYGIMLEILQNLMKEGRYFDLFDIFANITGVVIALLFTIYIQKV